MEMHLQREPTRDGATFGALRLGDSLERFAWTLEDAIREVALQPVAEWKIPGDTAIPAGRYEVVITPSTRFHRLLPLLVGVPGFDGVRIHPGSTVADTSGCLLVGLTKSGDQLRDSRLAFDALFERLKHALLSGSAWITIMNPLESENPLLADGKSPPQGNHA